MQYKAIALLAAVGSAAIFWAPTEAQATHQYYAPGYDGSYYAPAVTFYTPGVAFSFGAPAYYYDGTAYRFRDGYGPRSYYAQPGFYMNRWDDRDYRGGRRSR